MIEAYTFGKIIINGTQYTSDLKIIDGTVIPDWWRKEGHEVAAADIPDILESRPDILVIGKGKPGLMVADQSLHDTLLAKNIALVEEKTSKAIKTFNRLYSEGKKVAAGFHLTC